MLKTDRYAYAIGRIKVMETRLLDRDRIERMVEAKSADEALKVLGESEYSDYLADLADVHEYEKILSAELLRIYRELRQLSPEAKIIAFFARKATTAESTPPETPTTRPLVPVSLTLSESHLTVFSILVLVSIMFSPLGNTQNILAQALCLVNPSKCGEYFIKVWKN